MDWLLDPNYYNWLIFAGILLIIEVSTFTLLFLWLAIASLIVAFINFFMPEMSMTTQLTLFAISSVASVLTWHRLFKKAQDESGDSKMNNRAERYVGRTTILSEEVKNGRGKVQIDDSYWRVHCEQDLPKGSKVKIISAESVILNVEPS